MLRSHYTILVRWDSRWLPQRRPWWWVGWRSWWFGRGIGSLPDAQGRCDNRCQFKYWGVNVVVKNCLDSNTSRQKFWSRLIDYSGYKHFPTHVIMKYITIMRATCGHPWWDKRGWHPCSLGDLLLRGSRSLSSAIIWGMRNIYIVSIFHIILLIFRWRISFVFCQISRKNRTVPSPTWCEKMVRIL